MYAVQLYVLLLLVAICKTGLEVKHLGRTIRDMQPTLMKLVRSNYAHIQEIMN